MASDEQAALLAQIKALSGAIDQQKSSTRGGYNRNNNFHQPGHRGGSSFGRGRGGGSLSAATSRHRSLVLSGTGTNENGAASQEKDDTATPNTTTNAAEGTGSGEEGWVKRKSTHNMSLVSTTTFKKT